MVIKLSIGDLGLGIGVLELGILDWNPQSPIVKNTNPKFKITMWSFYHQLVISTFSSLLFAN